MTTPNLFDNADFPLESKHCRLFQHVMKSIFNALLIVWRLMSIVAVRYDRMAKHPVSHLSLYDTGVSQTTSFAPQSRALGDGAPNETRKPVSRPRESRHSSLVAFNPSTALPVCPAFRSLAPPSLPASITASTEVQNTLPPVPNTSAVQRPTPEPRGHRPLSVAQWTRPRAGRPAFLGSWAH